MHLRIGERAALEDLAGPQFVPPVDDGDFAGELGQEQPLLHRAVPSAHDEHSPVLVEKPIAGGAGGDPTPIELRLAGDFQAAGERPRSDDARPGMIDARCGPHLQGIDGEIHATHSLLQHGSIELLSLFVHPLGQLRPGYAVGETGEILHSLCVRYLTAR